MTIPRRRWSFGLMAMLVVATIVACWMGWNLKIVHDRYQMRTWIEQHGGAVYELAFPPTKSAEPSFIRRLMGDQKISSINVPESLTRTELAAIKKNFPESLVYTNDWALSNFHTDSP
jgi:hypothetical protein